MKIDKKKRNGARQGFTLVEVLIIVAILGILAAIVFPEYQNHAQLAKEAAAKDNLRILRNAIAQYAAQHKDKPIGFVNGNYSSSEAVAMAQLLFCTNQDGELSGNKEPNNNFIFGPYLPKLVENPFNGKENFTLLNESELFPTEPDNSTGWYYKPTTKEIKLNCQGVDSSGNKYYNY